MKNFNLFSIVLTILMIQGCKLTDDKTTFIDTQDHKFMDGAGNQIILHGINYVNKSAKIDTINFSNPKNFELMNKWGLNYIRLGVLWQGVEPNPGVYDEAYLKDLDYQIQLANSNNIHVLLDLHQDLYSQLFSDGAPEWATLTEGAIHVSDNPVWSDAYFTSPAVKTAITNFWKNKQAEDGIGIQDHYIKMWKMLAERYKENTTVIGFDLMNEPNIGWGNIKGQELMVGAFIEAYARETGDILSGEEVVGKWLSKNGRKKILEFISNPSIYAQVVDAMTPVYKDFEKEQLMPFYKKTIAAIREVNQNHLIFLETSMSSNMGVYTAIERIPNEEKLVYAPHGYDLVVDTPDALSPNNSRVDLIFNRHLESSKRLKMPLMIGEWGAFGSNGKALQSALQVTEFFEKSLSSDAYWDFRSDLGNSKLLKAISRAYPKTITGDLVEYSTNVEKGEASFKWNETIKGKNRFYIPKYYNLNNSKIVLSPIGEGFKLMETDGGWHINVPSALAQRTLIIKPF